MKQNKLGKRINEVRKARGLTADRLSEWCNINATYLRQIEGGAKMPSLPVFIDICKALHVSPDYLLQDELDETEIRNWDAVERSYSAKARACTRNDQGSSEVSGEIKQPGSSETVWLHFLCCLQEDDTLEKPERYVLT